MLSWEFPGHLQFPLQRLADACVYGLRGTGEPVVLRQLLLSHVLTGHVL
jgi:hypothetical protein